MLYNVAQLLKAPVGETRRYTIDEPFGPSDDVPFAGNVAGQVRLTRVNQGIVVDADLHAPVQLPCSRCLEEFVEDIPIRFQERYIPTIEMQTGLPVHEVEEDEDDEDVYTIDDHHVLDLREAVRQQALLALPMQPIHNPDCLGLCPVCGTNRNEHACACAERPGVDPRLAPLRALLPDGGPDGRANDVP